MSSHWSEINQMKGKLLTLLESVFLMYGSVPQAIFPISTFSNLATITMSVWGLVTEKMACMERMERF